MKNYSALAPVRGKHLHDLPHLRRVRAETHVSRRALQRGLVRTRRSPRRPEQNLKSHQCNLCAFSFQPTRFAKVNHRCCSHCMEAAASREPSFGEGAPLVRATGDKPLSHVERTAAGLSAASPGGWYQVIDAGRACNAFNLSLAELARLVGCHIAELTPRVQELVSPAGVFRTRDGFTRAVKCRRGWSAQIARANGSGVIKWRVVGKPQKTEAAAVRLATGTAAKQRSG